MPEEQEPFVAEDGKAIGGPVSLTGNAVSRVVGPGSISPWRPIATAPRDGTEVLLYDPEGTAIWRRIDEGQPSREPYLQKGSFWRGDWWMVDDQCGGLCRAEPTHWQPLPAPPEAT